MLWTLLPGEGISGARDGCEEASTGGFSPSPGLAGVGGTFGAAAGCGGAGAAAGGTLTLALCPHAAKDMRKIHESARAANRNALNFHFEQ